jgi:hypothetical protein
MSPLRALAVVLLSTLLFTAVGLGIGYSLGRYAPNYYRTVLLRGDSPDFDPVDVGIGLGLSQGSMFGGIIGVVLVVLHAWYDLRRRALEQAKHPDGSAGGLPHPG